MERNQQSMGSAGEGAGGFTKESAVWVVAGTFAKMKVKADRLDLA